jgi:hypothetical protein
MGQVLQVKATKRKRAYLQAGAVLNTEVKHPLLRACSTSAALMAAGKHTNVRVVISGALFK